jgi:trans-aconitate 2-methyltransferase
LSGADKKDWNPEAYARFRGLRLRPALDLLNAVGDLPDGAVVDLGCGDGAVAPALAARFGLRALVGVDASPAMLERADGYSRRVQADIATWVPDAPPALIFSNAALHWLADHARLLPRLAGFLAPQGVLAVQMPRQFLAPSHRFLRDIAASMFPDRFEFASYQPPVAAAVDYHALLSPLGAVDVWETDYVQRLEPTEGHPVRAFTASTAMRPILDKLTGTEAATFTAAYEQALGAAYPLQADGSVLFPFRRLFLTLKV